MGTISTAEPAKNIGTRLRAKPIVHAAKVNGAEGFIGSGRCAQLENPIGIPVCDLRAIGGRYRESLEHGLPR